MASEEQHAKVTLHWLDHSRSQRILWLLEELKIPYDIEIYHRDKTTMLAPPELEKIHALGKSPVITIVPAGGDPSKPMVLAESGFMTEYLCEHFPEGKRLMPKKWKEGKEGTIGGETEEWLRSQYFLHYCEGSFMPNLVMSIVVSQLKSNKVPFFIRPITGAAADRIFSNFIFPNVRKHLKLLDEQLKTSSGRYLCSDSLTAADILMSFPLIGGKERFDLMGQWEEGSWKTEFPRVLEYVELLEADPGYKQSVAKIEEIDGTFEPVL